MDYAVLYSCLSCWLRVLDIIEKPTCRYYTGKDWYKLCPKWGKSHKLYEKEHILLALIDFPRQNCTFSYSYRHRPTHLLSISFVAYHPCYWRSMVSSQFELKRWWLAPLWALWLSKNWNLDLISPLPPLSCYSSSYLKSCKDELPLDVINWSFFFLS